MIVLPEKKAIESTKKDKITKKYYYNDSYKRPEHIKSIPTCT